MNKVTNKLKIHFLNTIWSDAIILESNNHYAFIDTGSAFYYPMIEEHLKQYNINELDFIFITHFHNDHYGNCAKILQNYKVKTLYIKHYYGLDGSTSSGFTSNEEYIENEFKNYNNIIDSATKNNTSIIYIDELNIDFLEINFQNNIFEVYDIHNRLYDFYYNENSPYYKQLKFNENYNSVGLFTRTNNFNIFLGADLSCSKSEDPQLNNLSIQMLEKIYKKHNINHIDIYKSCHHGGGGTNTKELCDLLKTKYAIITNTARWLDNYPTFDNLKSANKDVNILTTDHQKYIFTIDDKITYEILKEESLFLALSKD